MTITPAIMRFGATEEVCAGYPAEGSPITPVFNRFSSLIDLLGEALDLDRQLEHSMSWDLAITCCAQDTELAWEECRALAVSVYEMPASHPSDHSMRRAAMLLHFAIEAGSPEELAQLQKIPRRHADMFIGFDNCSDALLSQAIRQIGEIGDTLGSHQVHAQKQALTAY